ncbi:MAG: DUF222 domain-containing protein [Micropruina sp.]|uniref:HNH endonuclease signature motif containing protein n=1 Tax=Micropruina sp. TaxID=2737536 RepID=UPI0039E3E7C6
MSIAVEPGTTVADFAIVVAGLLDELDYDKVPLLADRKQLDLVAELLQVQSRLSGVVHTVLGQVDRGGAAVAAYGVPTVSWLASELRYTRGQASAMLHHANDLHRFTQIGDALRDGRANERQAQAITQVLKKLPTDLGVEAEAKAQATMVGFCEEFNSHELAGLSRHLVEVVAPEVADEVEAKRQERELRDAQQARQLNFSDNGHGSTIIKGSLPSADAALIKAQIEALAQQMHRTALELRDPTVPQPSWPQRRADALVELARRVAIQQAAPKHGGDRPHLVVLIDYEDLLGDCRGAGLADGTQLTAGQLRQYACDAGILPVILGGASGVLDVGREQRLVTPDIRRALQVRDEGCVFPGCDRPAADCDAHHITPWAHGGQTSLSNLCLLCKHHHNLLEPDMKRAPELQWQIRISADGIAEVIPPRFVDKHRQPRSHQRFRPPE